MDNSSSYLSHYSVLKNEILEIFSEANERSGANKFADLTFGAGGHTFALANLGQTIQVFSFDQDQEALENGRHHIKEKNLETRVHLHNSNFVNFGEKISKDHKFSGILLDIGVSSHQFDAGERGFSFRFDAPLDMRMDQRSELTAAYILNHYDQEELENILFNLGEEKFAKNIVKSILERRLEKPIERTKELEDICFHAYPKKLRFGKIHPATKTFQALRISVNNELGVLTDVIGQLIPYLELGGVLAIISFHSLEDRIVKKSFKSLTTGEIPIEIITKKPIIPSEEEIFENSRSRSAKLRVLRRVESFPSKNKYKQLAERD